MNCNCGSKLDFSTCCEPFLTGQKLPTSAEQLMRSRYTAYTIENLDYIQSTLAPESKRDFDFNGTKKWAAQSKWLGLEILSTKKGAESDQKGEVEFMAKYSQNGEVFEHHEVSHFRKNEKGQWLFVEGDAHTHREGETHHHHHHVKQQTVVRESPKVGRNDPCPCGSGKKYKKCCGASV